MTDREFTQFEELEKLSNEELENIVVQGVNIHISSSRSSVAKRILDNRRLTEQIELSKKATEKATLFFEKSEKELTNLKTIVDSLSEITRLIKFLKEKWFPNRSIWIKLGSFILGTVLFGILINLIASAIEKFWFGW